jgi:uncharacterized protein
MEWVIPMRRPDCGISDKGLRGGTVTTPNAAAARRTLRDDVFICPVMVINEPKTTARPADPASSASVAWRSSQVQDRRQSPAPIPAGWILSGAPTAGTRTLFASADTHFSATLWHCTEGEFVWQYRSDEIIHILEGETFVDGRRLTAGDVAYFACGSRAHWRITQPVRKLAIHRSLDLPPLWRRIADKARKVIGQALGR